MSSHGIASGENPFEVDNAKSLSPERLVTSFVPTPEFGRLLSRKNHIILGARGSGKTALAKMLSHENLSQLVDYKPAKEAIENRTFIGMYVPTDVEWVGALANKKQWQSEAEAEEYFQWRLNLSTCYAFLTTLGSCLRTYFEEKGERARVERTVVENTAAAWSGGDIACSTIPHLQEYLEQLGYDREQQVTRKRVLGALPPGELPVGMTFDSPLFIPVRRGIALASRAMDLPDDSAWFLCLDELELLEPFHHKILNTYLRSHVGNLFFKITTMPYCHYTKDTNARVPVNVGDDFEYVYIDQQPVSDTPKETKAAYAFADNIARKRLAWKSPDWKKVTLEGLLGKSELLDPKKIDWETDSPIFALLRKHAGAAVVERAERLLGSPKKLSNEVARKIEGPLLLREAILTEGKGLDVYSGASMLVRCADGNPRRLIQLLKRLMQAAIDLNKKPEHTKLEKKLQTRTLMEYSQVVLHRVQSERKGGSELYDLIKLIGAYMNKRFTKEPLMADQVGSVYISIEEFPRQWDLVERAVGLGVLFPNIAERKADQIPNEEGVFHLAYVLAPYFHILPRRGTSVGLKKIMTTMQVRNRGQIPLEFTDEEKK